MIISVSYYCRSLAIPLGLQVPRSSIMVIGGIGGYGSWSKRFVVAGAQVCEGGM